MQEQVQRIGMGSVPRSITVLLLHEIVDLCKPARRLCTVALESLLLDFAHIFYEQKWRSAFSSSTSLKLSLVLIKLICRSQTMLWPYR